MFERFTDQARHVVVFAQQEARLLKHNYIGTEHILLGMLHEGEGLAADALEPLGVSLAAVRQRVRAIIGEGDAEPPGAIPFTPRAKKVLELSLREALQLGHRHIGPEHILLGLVREGEGVAAEILVVLAGDLEDVRAAVMDRVGGGHGESWAPLQRAPAHLLPPPPVQVSGACVLCGRDLWDVGRYVQGEQGAVCDQCVVLGARTLEEATPEERSVAQPPRVYGAERADPGSPEEISRSFRSAFDPSTTPQEHAAFIEDGEYVQPFLARAAERAANIIVAGVRVSRIRFIDPDRAKVRFLIELGSPPFGITYDGGAVRSGDRWLVSRDTIAQMVARAGVRLPRREGA